MKTSNILITTAMLIVIMALVTYNFGLKAEYKKLQKHSSKEYYKLNRFNNYNKANVNDFNALEINCANAINVRIEYGEKEAVWIQKNIEELVYVSQIGNILKVNLTKKGKQSNYIDNTIVIISPKIRKINTTAFAFGEGARTFVGTLKTIITGFSQDSLSLNIAPKTSVELERNQLKYLNASVGDLTGSGSLNVSSENNIDALNLHVLSKSNVELLDLDIKSIKSNISDGAILTFRGTALSKLNKE